MQATLFDSLSRKTETYSIAEKGVALVTLKTHRLEIREDEGITGHDIAAELFQRLLVQLTENAPYESLWVMALSTQHKVLGIHRICEGTTDQAAFYPRNLATFLLGLNSTACILGHNHPGGRDVFSPQDIQLTKAVKELCKSLQINLLDHILVVPQKNGTKVVSMLERMGL